VLPTRTPRPVRLPYQLDAEQVLLLSRKSPIVRLGPAQIALGWLCGSAMGAVADCRRDPLLPSLCREPVTDQNVSDYQGAASFVPRARVALWVRSRSRRRVKCYPHENRIFKTDALGCWCGRDGVATVPCTKEPSQGEGQCAGFLKIVLAGWVTVLVIVDTTQAAAVAKKFPHV
jgi:hypothetical protein